MKPFLLFAVICFAALAGNCQVRLYVHLDSTVNRSFTGRLLVFTSTDTVRGVPDNPSISDTQPKYEVEVKNWDKTKVMTIDDNVKCYSMKPSQLKPGSYSLATLVQTVQNIPFIKDFLLKDTSRKLMIMIYPKNGAGK